VPFKGGVLQSMEYDVGGIGYDMANALP